MINVFNDVANWAYADLPKAFRPDTSARSFVVKTNKDLRDALSVPDDTLIFVESIMDRHDALLPSLSAATGAPSSTAAPPGLGSQRWQTLSVAKPDA